MNSGDGNLTGTMMVQLTPAPSRFPLSRVSYTTFSRDCGD